MQKSDSCIKGKLPQDPHIYKITTICVSAETENLGRKQATAIVLNGHFCCIVCIWFFFSSGCFPYSAVISLHLIIYSQGVHLSCLLGWCRW